MRFDNRENQLIWERYNDPYSVLPEYDDEAIDPTVEDPSLGDEDGVRKLLDYVKEEQFDTESLRMDAQNGENDGNINEEQYGEKIMSKLLDLMTETRCMFIYIVYITYV